MRRKDREVTEKVQLEEILCKCRTCHLAMSDNGMPYVVPLSYGYQFLGNNTLELYFHSALEGKKLDILKKSPKVCFEISLEGEPVHTDIPCNSGYYFKSIIGYGDAVFLTGTAEKCAALSSIMKHQTGQAIAFKEDHLKNICIYKITSTEFTGKNKRRHTSRADLL